MRPPARPRRVAPVRVAPASASRRRQGPHAGATPPEAAPRGDAGEPSGGQAPRDGAGVPGGRRPGTQVVPGADGAVAWRPVRPSVVSTQSAERFAERVRLRRRLTRRRAAIVASVVAGLGVLGWLLLVSPVLALDVGELVVEGQGTVVEPSHVVEVVAAYDGVPLPRLDTVGLRREVLGVPGVRAAEVTRRWPHGLRVVLVSREPVAAVPDGDAFALLDREGVRVGSAEAPPDGLPVVDVPLDGDARAITAVLTVLEQLPPELRAELTGVSARSRDTVRLDLADGTVVEWGSADRSALKGRVVLTLRATEAGRTASVIDVSAPTLPITRS